MKRGRSEFISKAKGLADNFTIVSNEVIQSPTLSMAAKGLWVYLQSLPTDWRIHVDELASHFTNGRDAVRNTLKELIDVGLVDRVERPAGDGQAQYLKGYDYYVFSDFEGKRNFSSPEISEISGTLEKGTLKKGTLKKGTLKKGTLKKGTLKTRDYKENSTKKTHTKETEQRTHAQTRARDDFDFTFLNDQQSQFAELFFETWGCRQNSTAINSLQNFFHTGGAGLAEISDLENLKAYNDYQRLTGGKSVIRQPEFYLETASRDNWQIKLERQQEYKISQPTFKDLDAAKSKLRFSRMLNDIAERYSTPSTEPPANNYYPHSELPHLQDQTFAELFERCVKRFNLMEAEKMMWSERLSKMSLEEAVTTLNQKLAA